MCKSLSTENFFSKIIVETINYWATIFFADKATVYLKRNSSKKSSFLKSEAKPQCTC